MTIPTRTASEERGNAAVEAVCYMSALILLFGLIIAAGRVVMAHQAIEHVAFQAARTASLQRNAGAAEAAAHSEAEATLAAQHLDCDSSSTTIDTSGFSVPLGQPATVTVNTTCRLRFTGDLGVIPGSLELRAQATSAIDTYRAR